MSCCSNTYFLGCFNHCGQITFGTASATETLTAVFSFAGIDASFDIGTISGDPYTINIGGLNENTSYTLKLYNEDGTEHTVDVNGVEYDCFRFKTKIIYGASPVEYAETACCSPTTIVVQGQQSYQLTFGQWSQYGAIPEIQVVINIDGELQNIAFQQVYDSMPNPTTITITLPGAPDVWYIIIK